MHSSEQLGPFTLDAPIGRGATGEVWRAVHRASNTPVAIKTFGRMDPERIEDFNREVHNAARLTHPCVAAVLDYGIEEEGPWIAMELAEGGTLHDRLGRITWQEVEEVMVAILDALAHAHARGVLHFDIKPQNIVFQTPRSEVSLVDFGISSMVAAGHGQASDGTPGYMAPERIEGRWEHYSPATDLYSLACTLWKVVTGRRPFGGTPIQTLRGHLLLPPPVFEPRFEVPSGLEAWLNQLLKKGPGDRYSSAATAYRAAVATGVINGADPLPHLIGGLDGWTVEEASVAPLADTGRALLGLRTFPFVGRHRLREQLWHTLCSQPCSEAVALVGPAGVGKSRLARWFLEHGQQAGLVLPVTVRGDKTAGDADGLRTALRRLFKSENVPEADLQDRISSMLPDVQEDRWILEELLKDGTNDVPFVTQVAVMVRAWSHFAQERRVVLWVDDAQWAPQTMSFVEAMVQSQENILVVLTCRDDLLTDDPELNSRIKSLVANNWWPVPSLTGSEHQSLVGSLLPLNRSTADALVRRTQGNPLFAVQLVTDWAANGMLSPGPKGFGAPDKTPLPASLAEIWATEINRWIDAGDAAGVELGAIGGQRVNHDEWRTACRLEGITPSLALLYGLSRRHLIVVEADGWSFVHGMLREAIIESASPERIRNGHDTWARVLAGAEPRSADNERRAIHLVKAGHHEQAIGPLIQAADGCRRRSDPVRALSLLDEADRLMRQLGTPPTDEHSLRSQLVRAITLSVAGAHNDAFDGLSTLVTEPLPDPIAVDALAQLANLHRDRGELSAALHAYERAQSLDLMKSDRCRWAHLASHKAAILTMLGRPEKAEDLMQKGLQAQVEGGWKPGEVGTRLHLMALYLMTGRYGQALEQSFTALDICEAEGLVASRPLFLGNMGLAYLGQQEPEQAGRMFEEALRLARLLGHRYTTVINLANLGSLQLEQGNVSAAKRGLNEALSIANQHGYGHVGAVATGTLAHCMAQDGDLVRAVELVMQAEDKIRAIGDRNGLLTLLVEKGHVLLLSGRHDDANAVVAEAKQLKTSLQLDDATHLGRRVSQLQEAIAMV